MPQTPATLIVHSAAELVTCHSAGSPEGPRAGAAQADAGIIPNGAVAVRDGHILAAGPSDDVLHHYRNEDTDLVDATGKTVTPGLVDAHTHLVWGGYRDEEYEMRLRGATYLEIMAAGGGIMSTVRATRIAHEDELKSRTAERLRRMLEHGTTTVEIKSGYG
ncbi:MAG: amidohydrolase family protein, partial [Chloroflexota bacterium]|nr:amidohydrolase family protein [Chloroflexota bacterium]